MTVNLVIHTIFWHRMPHARVIESLSPGTGRYSMDADAEQRLIEKLRTLPAELRADVDRFVDLLRRSEATHRLLEEETIRRASTPWSVQDSGAAAPYHAQSLREGAAMTEVTMTLPDTLAQEARAAGLLTPHALEAMLRDQLRNQRLEELFGAMKNMTAVDMPMTETEIQAEVDAVRAQRRARRS
jgi:hypothetical protein